MHRSKLTLGFALSLVLAGGVVVTRAQTAGPLRFAISFPAARSAQPLDGRVLLFISDDGKTEPRRRRINTARTARGRFSASTSTASSRALTSSSTTRPWDGRHAA